MKAPACESPNPEFSEIAKQLGSRGGRKTALKHGTEYMRTLSLKAVEARRQKRQSKTL